VIAALVAAALVVPPPAGTDTRRILDALRQVETGGSRDPDRAVGDDGRALGAYQIHRIYWLDAVEHEPSLKSRGYEAVTDRAYAERVVIAYLSRYAQDWSIDTIARIHNGGPAGATKRRKATDGYAVKARRAFDAIEATKQRSTT
jgi:hypothetical protein